MVRVHLNGTIDMFEDDFKSIEDLMSFLLANHNTTVDLIRESEWQDIKITKIEIVTK